MPAFPYMAALPISHQGRCPEPCAARLEPCLRKPLVPRSPSTPPPPARWRRNGAGACPAGAALLGAGTGGSPSPLMGTGTGLRPPSSGPAAAGADFLASLIAAGPCDWLRGSDPARAPGWADKRGLSRGLPGIPGAGTRDRRPQHDGQSGRGAGPQPAR